tara:strand:+ start:106 stop:291 length:186 start_codon:yes stop_codon:yes gene_type:complete
MHRDTSTNAAANHILASMRHDPTMIERVFRDGVDPRKRKIPTKDEEKHRTELQSELLKVRN